MASSILHKACCSKCGAENTVPTYPNINVQTNPELKDKVRNGSIFLWSCGKCGQVNLAPYSTLYHDPQERVMVWLTPDSMPADEKAAVESHMQALSAQLQDPANAEILGDYTLRRAREVGELIEKVKIFEAGLDDVVVEMCKYVTKMELVEKETNTDKRNAILNAPFKFYKIEGADNYITLTYAVDGEMQGLEIGFNVYEDCLGIVKRNPNVRPAPGFSTIDAAWLSTKMR